MSADLAPHDLTSYTSHSPIVVAVSNNYGTNYGWKVFDALFLSTGNCWITNPPTKTGWMTIDFGAGVSYVVESYALVCGGSENFHRMPKTWTFLGSNDGASWVTLDTVASETAWLRGELRTFTCDVVNAPYRYFKLDITNTNAGADNYIQLGEVYIYGYNPGVIRRRII